MKNYRFSVVVERDDECFYAFCPELQGCYTDGKTYDEVMSKIEDAIRLHIEDRLEDGEEIPQAKSVILTSLDVAV